MIVKLLTGFVFLAGSFLSVKASNSYDINYDEQLINSLQNTFHKERPFYAISVTRKTANDNDYPQLPEEERIVVFQILEFLSGKSDVLFKTIHDLLNEKNLKDTLFLEEFSAQYPAVLTIYENKTTNPTQEQIKLYIDYLSGNNSSEIYALVYIILNEIENYFGVSDLQNKIKTYINNNHSKIYDAIPHDKRVNYFADIANFKIGKKDIPIIEEKILELFSQKSIKKFLEKECVKDILPENLIRFLALKTEQETDPTFENRKHHAKETLNFLHKIRQKITNSSYLIVFNEMFFGKAQSENQANAPTKHYAPFSFTDFETLSDSLKELSNNIPTALFYVNFLYFDQHTISGEKYKEYMNSIMRNKSFMKSNKQIILDEQSIDWEQFVNNTSNDKEYKYIKNETLIYTNGRIVNSYQKSSYKDEANKLLKNFDIDQAVYLPGEGKDEQKETSSLGSFVHTNFSSQTCYDLEIGVRKHLNNYPVHGKVHIIPSNTLPFSLSDITDLPTKTRFNNLPADIPLILHVDPLEQDLFLNPKKRKLSLNNIPIHKKENISHFVLHDPMYPNPFEIELGDNVFTFKFWDINAAFDKLSNY